MFFVECTNNEAIEAAMNILITCFVKVMQARQKKYLLLIVEVKEDDYESYRMCELTFQMNFAQKPGNHCGHCNEKPCGHITFTNPL